jgi:hypothetical protein
MLLNNNDKLIILSKSYLPQPHIQCTWVWCCLGMVYIEG